ncbi:MAG: nucleoside recognition protein [Ruminococcus sp.]|nr:nucleoside recognition protein [Ruminococcus sp.]
MLTVFSAEVAAAVKEAVFRCLNVIIPSLFAVMAVSTLLIKTGASGFLSYLLYPLKKLLDLPDSLFAVFVISCFAGYPVGIRLLSELYEDKLTDKRSASLMACCCYCGGPVFYSGTVGLAVFGSTRAGTLIFLSVAGAELTAAFFISRLFRPQAAPAGSKTELSSELLTDSVLSAGRSMFSVCVMIVMFSAVLALADVLIFGREDGLNNTVVLIKSCFEITGLTNLNGNPYGLLPAIAALCSFGGLCIVLQLCALKNPDLSLVPFLISRVPAAALSALLCRLLRPLMLPDNIAVTAQNKLLFNVNNFIPSICLILMIFLLNLKKSLVFSE